MRVSEAKKDVSVVDRWYPENGTGTIVSVKSEAHGTTIRVRFPVNGKLVKYDILSMANLEVVA